MTKRKIIKIDEDKCNGCGVCIPNCPEGALQVIDGKVRLISDIFCDGLGACIGHCPQGAISTEERDAKTYNERRVMENIIKAGKKTILAHLNHLKDHGEEGYLTQALDFLKQKGIAVPFEIKTNDGSRQHMCNCPGAAMKDFSGEKEQKSNEHGERVSHLRQWPVQLHLVPPTAPYFQGKDVLLIADCVAYCIADFHKNHLKGKSLAIACPKLDINQETYLKKLTALIDEANINKLSVMIMEVPCCRGLLALALKASANATRKIPITLTVVSIKGDVLKEEQIAEEKYEAI